MSEQQERNVSALMDLPKDEWEFRNLMEEALEHEDEDKVASIVLSAYLNVAPTGNGCEHPW